MNSGRWISDAWQAQWRQPRKELRKQNGGAPVERREDEKQKF
jgi:hypothetical protein